MDRRFIMYFRMHKTAILITLLVVVLIILSIIGMASLESYYRKIQLASMPLQFLMSGIHAMIFVFMYLVFMRGGFAELDKAPIKGKDVAIHWKDVIGMEAAKQEAWEVIQLIRDRAKLKKVGGQVVKGILMIGPPGCGKTYLAKAIATESHMPFISMSGSEFVEIFVGVGAARVRKLFKKARDLSFGYGGCILFMDEIDSVGSARTFSYLGGQEKDTTQNQLLAELDGLKSKDDNIVVIAATNAPEESLDKALLRPGRFDRKIYVSLPNLDDRQNLFKFYLDKVAHDDNIDVGRLARRAVQKSPADIASVVKEAALITTRVKKEKVGIAELSEAFERIELGIKHHLTMSQREKEIIAYHESGHLIVTYLLHPTDDVFKASIIPRKGMLGGVYHPPKGEYHIENKEKLLADIKVSVAGYASEKLKYGTTSTGASDDFAKAMRSAHFMVWRLGMGESDYVGDYTAIPVEQLSESVKKALNDDTNKILRDCITNVQKLLSDEREILDRFARELVLKQELEYDDIEAIFDEYGKKSLKGPA